MSKSSAPLSVVLLFFSVLLQGQILEPRLEFAHNFGGTYIDYATAIELDSANNIYCYGYFTGTAQFDPDSSVPALVGANSGALFLAKYSAGGQLLWVNSPGQGNPGGLTLDTNGNLFLTSYQQYNGAKIYKYDASGTHQWTKTINGEARAFSIAIDNTGNLYIGGHYSGSTDFDPGPSFHTLTNNYFNDPWMGPTYYTNLFLLSLDATGDFRWVRNAGGNSYNGVEDLTLHNDQIYFCGNFSDSIIFNPGSANPIQYQSSGGRDFFIVNYNSNGNFIWSQHLGSIGDDAAHAILTNDSGQIFTVGHFPRTIDMDPGAGTYTLQPFNNFRSGYCLKLDSTGNFQKAIQLTGTSNMSIENLIIDEMDRLHLSGNFIGSIDFNLGSGNHTLSTAGFSTEDFVAIYEPNDSLFWVGTTAGTDRKTVMAFQGENLFVAGSFFGRFDFDPSPDSLNLNAQYEDVYLYNLRFCESLPIDTFSIYTCADYTSGSGSKVWTQSGFYLDSFPSLRYCDSVVMIDLHIDLPDTTVIQSGFSLSAQDSNARYQWLECSANGYNLLTGDTLQTFNPIVDGHYAVILDNGFCSDTSACYSIQGIGLNNPLPLGLEIYPNPNQGRVKIKLGAFQQAISYSLYEANGKLVDYGELHAEPELDLEIKAPAGLYLLKLSRANGESLFLKLIRN